MSMCMGLLASWWTHRAYVYFVRGLSMVRRRQVMNLCETATLAHRVSGCSVANLVSPHAAATHSGHT